MSHWGFGPLGGSRACDENVLPSTDSWPYLCYHRADCHRCHRISPGASTKGSTPRWADIVLLWVMN